MLRIGTRGSKLALWQANFVKSQIQNKFPKLNIEIVVIKTIGDINLSDPLSEIGGKGVFIKGVVHQSGVTVVGIRHTVCIYLHGLIRKRGVMASK